MSSCNIRLKAGGKHQRLRVVYFRSFLIAIRDEGSKVGQYRKYFSENLEKIYRLHIKLQECAVIATYFTRARS
jgi:hypothetical protein